MSKNTFSSVGIEYDNYGIRAARISGTRQGTETRAAIENMIELKDNYTKDEVLIEGIRDAAKKISCKLSDCVIMCAAGRQVFVTQIRMKELPPAEMKKALRMEIRKNLSFETAGTVLDYQIMKRTATSFADEPSVTVTAVAKPLIDYQMRLLEKAGLKQACIIDVLPAALANAFWIGRKDAEPAKANVMIHFAPDMCTLVIDSQEHPFYTRSIYFPAEELCGTPEKELPPDEKTKQCDALGEELRRSISYYGTNFGPAEYGLLYYVGNYVQNETVRPFLKEKLGFAFDEAPLLKRMGSVKEAAPGKFDIAIALAMRGDGQM